MQQEENLDVEGESKCAVSEMTQEEETTSVFTHVTSVTPVENPWVCLTIVLILLGLLPNEDT